MRRIHVLCRNRMTRISLAAAAAAALVPAPVFAEEAADAASEPGEEELGSESDDETRAAEEEDSSRGEAAEVSGAQVDEAERAPTSAGFGATEERNKTYLFLGARYRNQIIPQAIQSWFVEGGETVYSHTPGVEFIIREDGFEYGLFGMVSFLTLDGVPFKGDDDIEVIDTNWSILYLGSDFTVSTDEFAPGLSATFGGGLGLGFFFGDMRRTEAYLPPGQSGIGSYQRCPGPGAFLECEVGNGDEVGHYNYLEPSWADGGASPLLIPWLAGQVGLRYKMHEKFVMHAEVGLNLLPPGVFLGVGADYGL